MCFIKKEIEGKGLSCSGLKGKECEKCIYYGCSEVDITENNKNLDLNG